MIVTEFLEEPCDSAVCSDAAMLSLANKVLGLHPLVK